MVSKIKYSCVVCKCEFTTNNLMTHHKRCMIHGKSFNMSFSSRLDCPFCEKVFSTSSGRGLHERLCDLNPNKKKKVYSKDHIAWNKGNRSKPDTRDPRYIGKIGGYRDNAGRSKKFRVNDSYGKEVVLQSTYELRCSEILNELNIAWVRPKALKYDGRNYFPDFYLPDFDVYLDPKNSYKAKLDFEKIEKVKEQNKVKVLILLDEQLNSEYITRVI